MSDEKRAGLCPVCGEYLAKDGDYIICPNGDYKTEFARWDEIWTRFNNLLNDLLAINEEVKK